MQIYIRFYGANCGIASNSQFEQSLDAWLSFARRILRRDGSTPLIFIGVPAMERASPVQGCYQSTRDLRELYKVCTALPLLVLDVYIASEREGGVRPLNVYEITEKLVMKQGLLRALGSLTKFQLIIHSLCWPWLVIA